MSDQLLRRRFLRLHSFALDNLSPVHDVLTTQDPLDSDKGFVWLLLNDELNTRDMLQRSRGMPIFFTT